VPFIVKVEGAASAAGRWAAYLTNMSEQPDMIASDHDDYHASHVGRRADESQFFLTTPFVPAISSKMGREFIALYLFDAAWPFKRRGIAGSMTLELKQRGLTNATGRTHNQQGSHLQGGGAPVIAGVEWLCGPA
jgi:hypothetical protein